MFKSFFVFNRLCFIILLLTLIGQLSVQALGSTDWLTSDNSLQDEQIQAHLIEYKQKDTRSLASAKKYTPVVFWHGMGDTAFGSINLERMALQKQYPGISVLSVQIGRSSVEDDLASYFVNINKQLDLVCQTILENDAIKEAGAVNAIGFSQGGQFMRALVQSCPLREHGIAVKNLISLGGQHQGVFGLPTCRSTTFCDYIRFMLSTGAYRKYVQEHLVQAEYWHDPRHESEYKSKNIFMPIMNNDNHINQTYRDNLLALENLVLVKFIQDDMVVPPESSHFGFYAPGQIKLIRPLEESPLYLEDRLGLKQLNDTGRLKLISIPGKHLQYKMPWFLTEIAAKYLDN